MKGHINKTSGFSLIELMIAVALGIVVVGATLGIFVSNRQTYIAAENVGRIQENARTAYEIMTRDVREAGGNSCSRNLLVMNVLTSPATNWWSNWTNPIVGYDNGAMPGTTDVAGTDAVEIKSSGTTVYTMASTVPGGGTTSGSFTLNTTTHDVLANDILMACDYRQAAIFQAATVSGATINYQLGGTPGNATTALSFRSPVVASGGTAYSYLPNAMITKLNATRWYIGDNGRGGRSLFRSVLRGNTTAEEEVAEGIRDMQITYLLPGGTSYVTAALVPLARWPEVNAVRIIYTLEGNDRIGTDGQTIQRTLAHTVTLRNRNS